MSGLQNFDFIYPTVLDKMPLRGRFRVPRNHRLELTIIDQDNQ